MSFCNEVILKRKVILKLNLCKKKSSHLLTSIELTSRPGPGVWNAELQSLGRAASGPSEEKKVWNQLSHSPSDLRAAPALQLLHCCTHCNCSVDLAAPTQWAKSCSCCTFQTSCLCFAGGRRCSFAANGDLDPHFAAAHQKTTFLARHPDWPPSQVLQLH